VERRIVLLLVAAAVCVAAAALHQSREHPHKHAQQGTTTRSSTPSSTVLGTTAAGTVTIPAKPTTQPPPPPAPGKHQHVPATTPRPAGDVVARSEVAARQQLEAYLATRPALEPYEDEIWYTAQYSYSNITAKGLAGLFWCVGYRVSACDRSADAAQR
jgi:hypothetical protein